MFETYLFANGSYTLCYGMLKGCKTQAVFFFITKIDIVYFYFMHSFELRDIFVLRSTHYYLYKDSKITNLLFLNTGLLYRRLKI